MTRKRVTTTVRYAFDQRNRLVVDTGDLLEPKKVLEGIISADINNRLIYRVIHASPHADAGPQVMNFDGTWALSRDHQLEFALHGAQPRGARTLYLKGAIIEAHTNALVFALHHREDDDLHSAQRLTLSGRWQADSANRLTFVAQKGDGEEDRLVFQGGWEIGPHHELRYQYRRRDLARRVQRVHELVFQGSWDIGKPGRLTYRLVGATDSAFEFKAGLKSRTLAAREGRIVYDVGVQVSQGVRRQRRVALYGTWKINQDLSLEFEVPYASGRVQAIRFEGSYAVNSRDRISVALRTAKGEPLGVTLAMTRKLLKDRELFLRLRADGEDTAILGGVQLRF